MKSFKLELDGESVIINPLHIVFAKVVGNKLIVKLTDGTTFEKDYDNENEAQYALVQSHWDASLQVSEALSSISYKYDK